MKKSDCVDVGTDPVSKGDWSVYPTDIAKESTFIRFQLRSPVNAALSVPSSISSRGSERAYRRAIHWRFSL